MLGCYKGAAHLLRSVTERAAVLPPRPCRLCTASCSESLLLLDTSDPLFSTRSCGARTRAFREGIVCL